MQKDLSGNKPFQENNRIAGTKIPTKGQVFRRAAVHASFSLFCASLIYFLPHWAAAILIAAITLALLSAEFLRLFPSLVQSFFSTIFSPFLRESETRKLSGAAYLVIGFLTVTLFFDKYISVCAIVFVALGDSTSAVSYFFGGKRKLWGKFVEGSVACLAVCLIAGAILAQIAGFPHIAVIITGAIIASLIQALPSRLNDNFSMPVAAALAMYFTSAILHW